MRIVLTNDDGYDAIGLRALWEALRMLPDVQVEVIAPAEAFSGKGHVVSPAVRFRRTDINGMGPGIIVEGTPGDCVRVSVAIPDQPPPDLVIAGINHGSNLGVDVFYSGTVAAAREAIILGFPAIAVSQLTRAELPDDWPRSTCETAAVLAALIHPDRPAPPGADAHVHAAAQTAIGQESSRPILDPGHYWNVNLPRPPENAPPTGVHLAPVSTDPLVIRYSHRRDDDGNEHLEYTGKYHERFGTPGTDVAVVFGGGIAISRLTL